MLGTIDLSDTCSRIDLADTSVLYLYKFIYVTYSDHGSPYSYAIAQVTVDLAKIQYSF